ncbi:hypothetical protein [Avibacterium sp. 21-599]|uniref:hypothetical protein n=1 Tax=Avibacterium sp. 21-599 TaxID=2911528 RepID=UPI0022464A77|nr:hypothetical protein [Avibacterium sp. 21-599]MCW9717492.1 hypothetical protein [Avibacterium sp. 21-599]
MRIFRQFMEQAMMEEKMNKADIYIYKVQYDEDKNSISGVKGEFTSDGSTFNLSRALIVSLLKTKNYQSKLVRKEMVNGLLGMMSFFMMMNLSQPQEIKEDLII